MDSGHLRVTRWWDLAERIRQCRTSLPDNPLTWFRETFDSAVRYRLISDVPVGVLLSGGLDSSSVAFSVSRQGMASGVSSFTVQIREKGYDEGPLAARVARMSGMHHHELSVRQDEML